MKYELYQINDDHRDLLFESYSESRPVLRENYNLVYQGTIAENAIGDALEELYCMFNMNRPADFTGHSMSVSDVVVLEGTAWYCDAIGFKRISFT